MVSSVASRADNPPARDEARRLFDAQPRKVERVRQATEALTAVANANAKDYDDQWHAARAWCWLADYGATEDEKRRAGQKGVEFTNRARQLDGKRVEGHYFHARSIGMLADIERGLKALGRVKEMARSLERAIEVDEKFDEGGPHRLLGLLQLDTPGWPISIGNVKEAEKHIRRAAELSPTYPENQIALAKLLHKKKNDDGARAALRKALEHTPWPTKLDEESNWKETINRYLK
jgi:tetratricopeptide (TPR) repeat protein